MKIVNAVLGVPLGYLVYFAYKITGNYGVAILFFALFVKAIMFPLNIVTQKNSIRLLQLQPSLREINQRYAGDKEQIGEAQFELYKKEKYSPFVGLIPLFIQLVLIIGILQVMYNPLQHMLHLDANAIDALIGTTREIYGIQGGFGEQLAAIDAVHQVENGDYFQAAMVNIQNGSTILQQVADTNLTFLGINLGEIPSLSHPTPALAIPALAGLSALALCLVQNAISPGALSQGPVSKWGLTIFTVAFSLYFTFVVPSGVGVYWTASNLLGIAAAWLLDIMYSPKKLAADALALNKNRLSPAEARAEKGKKAELARRQKEDARRFTMADKKLVFFAISSGQYKYFQTIIQYLLNHSNIVVHYLTTDPDDAVFNQSHANFVPYYVGESKAVAMMLRLEAEMVAMTVPDLQKFHIKRSVAKEDVEYVYIFHSMTSVHMVLRQGAVDHYDTVFCVGPHQVEEIRRTEQVYDLPKKRLVKAGSSIADILLEKTRGLRSSANPRPQLLVAPSWQVDCIMDTCLDEILEQLVGDKYHVIVRPHPEYIKRFPERMANVLERWGNKEQEGLSFELNYASNDSVYQSDIVITDWSTIALEFSYCTKRPSLFVNTPMKVMNLEYKRIGIEPSDITLRHIIGQDVDMDHLSQLPELVDSLLGEREKYELQITEFMQEHLFYPGKSGEAGGKYIAGRLDTKNMQ